MALWRCEGEGCRTLYAVGLFRCPRCHGTSFHEEGSTMPKITRNGGSTNAAAAGDVNGETGAPAAAAPTDGSTSSPGSSSGTSPEKPATPPETKRPVRRKRARTTESRSAPAPTGGSTAPTTVGDRTAPTSAPDTPTDE